MPEQEKRVKTIEGLKELRSHFHALAGIASSKQTRAGHIESARIIDDAIILLKASEPVTPDIEGNTEYDGHGSWWHVCGACRQPIDKDDAFCRWCGKPVNWND